MGEPYNTRIELRIVIIIDGKRIGIESRGDKRTIVEESLETFAEVKCEVILCATRSRGGTCTAVEEFVKANRYKQDRIDKVPEPVEALQDKANEKLARKLVKDIERALA